MFCLQCSSPTFRKSLCDFCWNTLRFAKRLTVREVESFPVFTLWEWPLNHPLKALWLQNLKGQEDERAWVDVAELLREFPSPQAPPWGADTLWIPLPSSGKANHALGLARALSRAYGGTLWSGLEITEKDEQKNKSRQERKERKIRPLGRVPCSSFRTVCFVDDIITTGSTFKGAFAALEYPENGLGLALMNRPLSE